MDVVSSCPKQKRTVEVPKQATEFGGSPTWETMSAFWWEDGKFNILYKRGAK